LLPANGRFSLVKTTIVDYPGIVAAAVFLPGCHLRCPYCQNGDLVRPDPPGEILNCDRECFNAFLNRRKSVLKGVVFSGGEALLHPLLPSLVADVKAADLKIKLDTAGLLPDRLQTFLKEDRLDYVAMDLKTLPSRYRELGWKGKADAADLLKQTLCLLRNSRASFEIRTTVVPGLVDQTDLLELSDFLEPGELWIWQAYRRGATLDPEWSNLEEPDEELMEGWRQNHPRQNDIRIR